MREIEGLYLNKNNMNYEKEFGVTAAQVKREVIKIKTEKRQYDEYGEPVYNQTIKRKEVIG